MSWLSALPVIDKIIAEPMDTILGKPDADDRPAFEKAMQQVDQAFRLRLAQLEVNKTEAAHSSRDGTRIASMKSPRKAL